VQLRRTRQDKPFVRNAKSGGWRADLSPKSVALIETVWGDLMQNLGYSLSGAGQKRETGQLIQNVERTSKDIPVV